MRFHFLSKLTIMLLAMIVIATCLTFGAVRQTTFAKSSSCSQASGSGIVAIAEAICNGQGKAINGWPGNLIVPYISGGGHYSKSPGPNTGSGSCKSGLACGVDCSGFTRWVYDLAYGSDVLKDNKSQQSDTKHQILLVTKVVPDSSAIPGDLVFFGSSEAKTSHVGIYIGPNQMIDSPNAKGHPPHQVRVDPIKVGFGPVLGYYRYIPSPTSDDWPMFGYDATNSRYNSHETILSPSTVGKLIKGWSALGGGDTNSPAVANGVVYVGGVDGKLYALNASTGATLWSSNAIGGAVFSSPAVANGVVYVGSDDGNLYALDATKQAPPLWKYLTGGAVDSSPTVANGVVYVGSSDGKLYALNASTGQLSWPSPYSTGGAISSSPTVANGVVYVSSSDYKLYALNASTGQLSWPSMHFICSPSSPAVANGVLYVATGCGDLYAINASTGAVLWTEHTVGGASGSPAVANGVVYVGYTYGNYASLYAFDATKQAPPLWSYLTDGYSIGDSPAVANGVVYVGSNYGSLSALNASTGTSLWKYPGSGAIWESPTVANGTVYFGEFAGYLDAFHL